jgi:hypothetical protein
MTSFRSPERFQEQIILGCGLQPADNSESAIVVALDPGSYTAIVRGTNVTTGIAVVDVFDLGTASAIASSGSARVSNIATRGFVNTGDNVMIGRVIIQGQPTRVIIRAIGPALTQFGVPDALANPTLELHDATSTIAQNDDWQTTQLHGHRARSEQHHGQCPRGSLCVAVGFLGKSRSVKNSYSGARTRRRAVFCEPRHRASVGPVETEFPANKDRHGSKFSLTT